MSGRRKPIPGAVEGKVRRRCDCDGPFVLVRSFHGISTYQCLTCRRVSEVETRTGKTCLACGTPLKGRQQNWCSDQCGREYANHKSRPWWAQAVKERDGYTCQRCGWRETPEILDAYRLARSEAFADYYKRPREERKPFGRVEWEARRAADYRQLEAHHITPIEWGGPEFDLDNGVCLCDLCHDEVHRELDKAPVG